MKKYLLILSLILGVAITASANFYTHYALPPLVANPQNIPGYEVAMDSGGNLLTDSDDKFSYLYVTE